MDAFSYNNIFETKGIEYLVVIAFFMLLIPFWIILNKKSKVSGQMQNVPGILNARILRIPQGIFYSRNHTWTHLEASGIANVGLDDLLLHITGSVKFSPLKNPGELVKKGDPLAEIEHHGKTLRIFSPLSGEITDMNSAVNRSPELLNEDPYLKGWLYKVKPARWMAETNSFYFAGDATNWMGKELERFRDFLSGSAEKLSPGSARLIMQDGGEMNDHTLSDLPAEVWLSFQERFMNPADSSENRA